ncbi:hypothetical protein BU24DRAFT_246474 [Aaosphaeria arxii CBS 175.79]|uniref:Uncharacterized protein n=1 Tax=Aaosphaeria arxii CBS 175.79 TaxID=1450172 RepID=A0A6A5XKF9_9PLEO|nr:uncharacterized protein BU24DRAFT_246474 [Aaosphaeria arxii CBS 175.79]KAF2013768.1 hypothetical protein BU24DRAFT_246474 [Aaosphaeria arxii CBS 175.79]
MGGRLSMPRGPDGMNEASRPTSANPVARLTRGGGIINGRTIMAPLAAFTMAGLLFVYSRTSIRAAKLNAQKHREADGGQISWHNESRRRHGQLDKVENDRTTFKEALLADVKRKGKAKKDNKQDHEHEIEGRAERSSEEAELRKMMGKKD